MVTTDMSLALVSVLLNLMVLNALREKENLLSKTHNLILANLCCANLVRNHHKSQHELLLKIFPDKRSAGEEYIHRAPRLRSKRPGDPVPLGLLLPLHSGPPDHLGSPPLEHGRPLLAGASSEDSQYQGGTSGRDFSWCNILQSD